MSFVPRLQDAARRGTFRCQSSRRGEGCAGPRSFETNAASILCRVEAALMRRLHLPPANWVSTGTKQVQGGAE